MLLLDSSDITHIELSSYTSGELPHIESVEWTHPQDRSKA